MGIYSQIVGGNEMTKELKDRINSMGKQERKVAAWEIDNLAESIKSILRIDNGDCDENIIRQ